MQQQATRIKELESAIDNELVMSHLGVFNSGDDPKVALNKLQCYSEGVGGYFAFNQLREQATEISQLKSVIAKCEDALLSLEAMSWSRNFNFARGDEALAAIKELENGTTD